jgi:hypothetical protein
VCRKKRSTNIASIPMNLMVKLPKWGAQRVCISVMGSRQGLSNGFTGIQLDEKRVMRGSALAGTNTDNGG